MHATRRTILATPLLAAPALAQDRPTRFVVPYPPGGPTDLVARVTSAGLPGTIVENRPGAAGSIGAGEVARAAPDGSVFLVNASAHVIVPHLQRNMPFDSLADFTPITEIVKVPLILVVNEAVPARSVAELIALARAQPGRLSYASSSIGGAPHLAGELFKLMTRTDMVHVPYRGSGPALQDLLGGTVQLMFDSLASSAAHIRAGRLRALAVTTPQRLPANPDLPTVAETVQGYEISTWYGLWGPPRLPAALATRMQENVARVLATPEAQARFLAMGAEPVASTPEAFARFVRAEYDRFGALIRDADIKGE
ncbi:MAG: tripartite tricarboxylate transporter substrate binding protein [Roseococcus sp.]|nr:tripartite tricarboxylate transporter substrate binding protein [Roseococcus sp.]